MNEAPIIASHIEAEVIVGNIIGKVDVRSDIKSGHTVEGVDIVKTVDKVAPIVVSHVDTKAAAGNIVEEAPLIVRDVDKQTMDIFEEASLIVRDVDVLVQLQESDISPRLERSHSQVMENNAQFYGKNDVQIKPEDKKVFELSGRNAPSHP